MFLFRKRKGVTCTISSSAKRDDPGLLPAVERYTGTHIKLVRSAGGRRPLFILSGKFGLIEAKERISYYEHVLVPEELEKLATRVAQQIVEHKISVVFYFYEPREGWSLYTDALRMGTALGGAGIVYMSPLKITGAPEEVSQPIGVTALA